MAIKTFTVSGRGKGRPDYSPIVGTSKASVGADQVSWYATQEGEVPGLSAVDWINYTVPEGYALHVCAGLISCSEDEIHRVAMNFSPALLGTISYKQLLALPLNPSATYKIAAGSLLYVRVYNDNAAARTFCVSLTGFLEVSE